MLVTQSKEKIPTKNLACLSYAKHLSRDVLEARPIFSKPKP